MLRRRDQGRCDNHLTIRRDEVEARVLKALEEKLLNQELFEEFCEEFTREMNRLRMQHRASLSASEREIERIEARRKKLIEMVKRALHDAVLDPRYLQLEITESKIMKNPVMAIVSLNELKSMGVRIALDDFGTGHSSLNYLRQIPLDYVKIDRSFIRNLETSSHDAAIVKSVIALAHSLNFKVIAEGVETEEQLAFLRAHKCDEMQGYLFSEPVPAEEFLRLLEKEGDR